MIRKNLTNPDELIKKENVWEKAGYRFYRECVDDEDLDTPRVMVERKITKIGSSLNDI